MGVDINCSVDGRTLDEFANVIQQRSKFLNETTEQSIAACAIDILKSLRTVTKVADPKSEKVEVKAVSNLVPSFRGSFVKDSPKKPCLRYAGKNGARYIPKENERVRFCDGVKRLKLKRVFLCEDNSADGKTVKYLLVAISSNVARDAMKKIVEARIKRYRGLAKTALGLLMKKTCTYNVQDSFSSHATAKADQMTKKTEMRNGGFDSGEYGLTLEDNLRYAVSALNGGSNVVETQIQKSMNKIVGLINHRCKGMLGFNKIETPFPEVKRK